MRILKVIALAIPMLAIAIIGMACCLIGADWLELRCEAWFEEMKLQLEKL